MSAKYHTAHQMSKITKQVRSFCLTASAKPCQFKYNPIDNIQKTSRDHLAKFYGRPLLYSPDQLFPLGVLICPTASKTLCRIYIDNILHCTLAVCKLLSQTKVEIMPISIRPVMIKIIVRFSGCGLSHREMSRITGVLQCDISKILDSFQISAVLEGVTWASVEHDYMERRLCPFLYRDGEHVSLNVHDRGEANKAHQMSYLCLHGPKAVSSGWISPKTSREMPQTDS